FYALTDANSLFTNIFRFWETMDVNLFLVRRKKSFLLNNSILEHLNRLYDFQSEKIVFFKSTFIKKNNKFSFFAFHNYCAQFSYKYFYFLKNLRLRRFINVLHFSEQQTEKFVNLTRISTLDGFNISITQQYVSLFINSMCILNFMSTFN